MNIQYSTKNVTMTPDLREKVEYQFTKFNKVLSEPYRVCVNMEKKSDSKHKIEVTIKGKKTYRVECYNTSLYSAIDDAEAKMYRILRKAKEKTEDRYHKPISIRTNTRDYDVPFPDDTKKSIISKVKEFPVKPLSVEEAIDEMINTDHDFYVFENVENHKVEVVYLRNDESFGLIKLVD